MLPRKPQKEKYESWLRKNFNVNNSYIDFCEWQGKTYLTIQTNQLGDYYMCYAEFDGTPGELIKTFFINFQNKTTIPKWSFCF